MGTPLAELIADLRLDLGDDSLGEATAHRAIVRALAVLNADVEGSYEIIDTNGQKEIEPELTPLYRELLLMRALAHLVRITRSGADVKVSFKSGDKQVTRTASGWKEMERVLLDDYYRLLGKPDPSEGVNILTPDVAPVIYSRGSDLE